MIELEDAIVKAKDFLRCSEIGKVLETPEYWILYDKTNEVEIGGYGALISKDTGETVPFVLPDKKNFELLGKSTEVVI